MGCTRQDSPCVIPNGNNAISGAPVKCFLVYSTIVAGTDFVIAGAPYESRLQEDDIDVKIVSSLGIYPKRKIILTPLQRSHQLLAITS